MVHNAPVVIFVFKRYLETKKVVESLLSNPESSKTDVIFYVDGGRTSLEWNEIAVVVKYISQIVGFKSISIIERRTNYGLASSFIEGITEVLSIHPYAIFLEDDNLVSNQFLKYMNLALKIYENREEVISISGYTYPLFPKTKKPYLVHGADTWSMGTWARGWALFEENADIALDKINKLGLKKKINMYGFDYYDMLVQQVEGKIDSWGVRWWATAVLNNKVSIFPGVPLCINIGGNSRGTHTLAWDPLFGRELDLAQELDLKALESIRDLNFVFFRFKLMHAILKFQRTLVRLKRIINKFMVSN